MLGNDLIDLQEAALASNWRRKGYLDKIFSEEEKLQILGSENPATLVWLFWSMKEAAYKIVNRETHLRFYRPTAFVCKYKSEGEASTGEVHYNGQIYYTQSSITTTIIHTIATLQKQHFGVVEIIYLPNTNSYLRAFNSTSTNYTLTKDVFGIPELINKDSGKKHPASVSHHGRFLSIVSLINETC